MKDSQLHLEQYLPAAGAAVATGYLDLGIDNPGTSLSGIGNTSFSNNWRLGFIRVSVPALPNNTNNANAITLTFQDSADGAQTFQQGGTGTAAGLPLVQVQVYGVANTGSPATVVAASRYWTPRKIGRAHV